MAGTRRLLGRRHRRDGQQQFHQVLVAAVGHRHIHRAAARDAVEELVAQRQGIGGDPGLAARPALDVGRLEQVLAQPTLKGCHVAGFKAGVSQYAQGADHQIDRRLDHGARVVGGAELGRCQQAFHQRAKFVARIAEGGGQAAYLSRFGLG